MRIAASGFGLTTNWTISSDRDDRSPTYDVSLAQDPAMVRDPLFDCIETRTVQRRPMKTTPLTVVQRLWLTATHQGLHLQPQMTPMIFR
jgi:hypothetical protein